MPEQGQATWAPWYHYVFALAVTNAVAQTVLRRAHDVVNVAVTVVIIAVVTTAVTIWWRSRHRTTDPA